MGRGRPAAATTRSNRGGRRERRELFEGACSAVFASLRLLLLASETVAETGPDLDLDGGVADHLVVALQVKHHAVDAGADKCAK